MSRGAMRKKDKYYYIELTRREFDSVARVLADYSIDCAISTKTLSAVDRVIKKMMKEATNHKEKV